MAIQFACPLCGKQTVVADQYAGQSGPCAHCGGTITIPLSGLGPQGQTSAPQSGGGASVLFVILAVLGGGVLVCCGGAFFLYRVGTAQMQVTQQRLVSQNNLKQIGLALHNYHDTHGSFPPAVVTDDNGTPLYSGRVLLLPFLEEGSVYQRFDKSKAWDSPENITLSQTPIAVFQDRANKTGTATRSDYVFATGAGTIFDGSKSVDFGQVTDGLSNTVLVIGTTSGPANWAAPTDWSIDSGTVPASAHPDKLLLLYGDGSVRMMKPQYFRENMRALTSKSGGDILPREP
jgi:hypothetical protein